MKSEHEVLEKLTAASNVHMSPQKQQEIWNTIEQKISQEQSIQSTHSTASKKSKRNWMYLGGVGIAAVVALTIGVTSYSHHGTNSKSLASSPPNVSTTQPGPIQRGPSKGPGLAGINLPPNIVYNGKVYSVMISNNVENLVGKPIGTYSHFKVYQIKGATPSNKVAIQVGKNVYHEADYVLPDTFTLKGQKFTIKNPNQGPAANEVDQHLGKVDGFDMYSVKNKDAHHLIALHIHGPIYMSASR